MNFMLIIFQIHSHYPSWRKFFDGLSDDEKLVYDDIRGPSWSPAKRIKNHH